MAHSRQRKNTVFGIDLWMTRVASLIAVANF